jgi:hypothetical protein
MVITENSTVPFCYFMAEIPGGHYRYFFSIHAGIPGGVFLEYFDHIGKGYKKSTRRRLLLKRRAIYFAIELAGRLRPPFSCPARCDARPAISRPWDSQHIH